MFDGRCRQAGGKGEGQALLQAVSQPPNCPKKSAREICWWLRGWFKCHICACDTWGTTRATGPVVESWLQLGSAPSACCAVWGQIGLSEPIWSQVLALGPEKETLAELLQRWHVPLNFKKRANALHLHYLS
jgi:hypothetical protein